MEYGKQKNKMIKKMIMVIMMMVSQNRSKIKKKMDYGKL